MSSRQIIIGLFIALLLVSAAQATTLHGTVYNSDLTVAKDALVTVNTAPVQRLLSTDGTYTFTLPPGNYTINATSVQDSTEVASEKVTVAQEGNFTFDLFFFPNLDEENALYNDIATDFKQVPEDPSEIPGKVSVWPTIVLLLIAALLVLGPIIYLRWHFRAVTEEEAIDEKLQEIILLLKNEGGRMTQKELRKRLPDSEAKISLLVAELETKGKLQKIKKGRGNILVLKK